MDQSDDEVCIRCGAPAERGYIYGNAMQWGPPGTKRWFGLTYPPRESLVQLNGRMSIKTAALRCPRCRTIWLRY